MEQNATKKIVGIAWIRTYASREESLHCLYKIAQEGDRYSAELVSADKLAIAWGWLRTTCKWRAHGVYYAGVPGIIWTQNLDQIRSAVDQFVGEGRWRFQEILLAPVRFHFGSDLCGYPHMKTTRSGLTLRTLRSRFPRAGELAFVPLEILLRENAVGLTGSGPGSAPQLQTEGVYG